MKNSYSLFVLYFLVFILASSKTLFAFHIVGGEITYECLSNNQYRITLNVYRDCACTNCADLDDPAYIFIFNNNTPNANPVKLEVALESVTEVDPPDDLCLETLPPNLCVQKGVYTLFTNLTPNSAGYTVVYQRYSRNSTIVNIWLPDQTGSSYTAQIPPSASASCNDSPVFSNLPPTVLCAGFPIHISQAASDANGDSLVYELCDPLIGGSGDCPQPGDPNSNCPTIPPPPYNSVDWINPYNANNPLGGNDPISIDPQTGMLTGTPPNLGQYVVAICVSEYRNGVLLGQIRRDFQFNVADCNSVLAVAQADSVSAVGTYFITDCEEDFSVQFFNNSIGAIAYTWNFGDPTTTTDLSTLVNPTYAYPDTGTYHVQLIAFSSSALCMDTADIVLQLYPTLTPAFTFEAQCAGLPFSFIDQSTTTYGTINAWTWDFGDGTGSNLPNPTHIFPNTSSSYNVVLTTETDLGCIRSTQQTVNVLPIPNIVFSSTFLCPQIPVTFAATPNNAPAASWQWSFGDPASGINNTSTLTEPIHTFTPGDYTVNVTVTGENGCISTYTQPITIYSYFTADAGLDAEICREDSVQLAANDEYPWFNYAWSPTDYINDPTSKAPWVSPINTTTYTVTISDPNGCYETDQVSVFVNPLPNVQIDADTIVCLGSNASLNAILGNNVVSHQWIGNGVSNPSAINIVTTPDSSTLYVLSAIDDKGCINQDSIEIQVLLPIDGQVGGDADICKGESANLNASGGITYLWQPPTGLDNPNVANPIASPSQTTQYIVTIANACFDERDTVLVEIRPTPLIDAGADLIFNVGDTLSLNATSDGDYTYLWQPDTGLNDVNILRPEANPLQNTVYVLNATSAYGCESADSVRITITNIYEIVLPNAFSPNGDELNDVFRIIHTRGIRELKAFRIYNRWGQLVYEATNLQRNDDNTYAGWNGTFRGLEQETGVYAYYVEGTTFLDEPFIKKGNISLVR